MNFKVAQKKDKLWFVLTSQGTRESDYGNNIYLVVDENKCLAYMNVSFDNGVPYITAYKRDFSRDKDIVCVEKLESLLLRKAEAFLRFLDTK